MKIDETLTRIHRDLDDPGRVTATRKHSIGQRLRLEIVRDLVLFGPGSPRLNRNLTRLGETLGRELDLTGALQLDLAFPERESARLAPRAPDPSPVATELLSRFRRSPLEFVIHGSHADSSHTEYSDVDCSVFVSGEIADPAHRSATHNGLQALNRHIRFLDPASHHGSFVFYAEDLACYPQSFMPLSAWNTGLANFSDKRVQTRPDPDLAFQNLVHWTDVTFDLIRRVRHSEAHIKAILSTYFICLVRFVQFVSGDYRSKRDILSRPDLFCTNQAHLTVFRRCGEVRKHWRRGQDSYVPSSSLLAGIAGHLRALTDGLQDDFVRHRLEGSLAR